MSKTNRARDIGSIPDGEKALIGQILARIPLSEWIAKDLEPLYDHYCRDPWLRLVAKTRRDAEVSK